MRNSKIVLFVFILSCLFSCNTTEPSNYTTWHCVESSASGTRTYLVNIYKAAKDTNTLLISNFHNISYEGDYDVIVKNKNGTLTFLTEQIGNSQFVITSPKATVNGNFTQMIFDYNIYNMNDKSEIGFHAVYNR
ncbi:MAG: hypothetical protein QM800_07740 [Paludibacter sp.]